MFPRRRPLLTELHPPSLAERVHRSPPAVEVLRDAVFVPRALGPDTDDPAWGLFRSDGALCAAAEERRGHLNAPTGSARTAARPRELPAAPDALYVYVGVMHAHFGHFLLSSLARLWAAPTPRREVRLLVQVEPPVEARLAQPYIRDCLAALGIGREHLTVFDTPVRLGEVIVPGPSFQEDGFSHVAHGDLGARIGAGLIGAPPPRGVTPVYLSKARLPSGITRIVNEAALEAELERRGVRIVHPETLPLAEQVRVLEEARTVLAVQGSALHATLLSQRPLRIRAIANRAELTLNYPLADAAKRHDARYYLPTDLRLLPRPINDFHLEWELPDPRGLAREFLDAAMA